MNLSKILPKHREMMLKTKNGDLLNNKTSKLVTHKIWPLLYVQDQEECTRDTCLQQMINQPDQPRSPTLLHTDRHAVSQGRFDNNNRESFHCAIGSILSVAQCFGILPLAGVRSESPRKLEFKIFSPSTAYSVAIMVMLFLMASIAVCHMIYALKVDTFGSFTDATSIAIFYINSLLGTALFMWLAPHWISLQRDWRAMEHFLDRDKQQSPRLRWKFSMLTVAIMVIAQLENVLAYLRYIPLEFWSSASSLTVGDAVQSMSEISHPFIFKLCNYNLGIGIFILSINVAGSFTWNFTDVFIMLVSIGLAERYRTLNLRLHGKTLAHRRNVDWRHLRESYATLSKLVKRVDSNISPLILLSFANNLYFICLQLFSGLSPQRDNVLGTVYFLVSFALLVGRTSAVTLLAANINYQSRVALPELYNCPGAAYNIETQRLQQQLSTDQVCLTGMRFFSITRNFLLTVVGTMVTYEVFLLSSVSQ